MTSEPVMMLIIIHNLWRECMFVLYRYHFEQIYNIDWTVYSCFLLNLMICSALMVCPAPSPLEQQTRFTPVSHEAVHTGFTPDLKQTGSKLTPPPPPTCVRQLNMTSRPFAVCLAACKYQNRKWCHSRDAANPVWTWASCWRQVETGSKMAPGLTVCTVCVSVISSAVCYIPAGPIRGRRAADMSVWTLHQLFA